MTPRQESWTASAALFALTCALFAVSVYWRAPGLGHLPAGISSWTNTGTTLCAKHWYREGPCNLLFTMYRHPASVENPTPADRTPYLSFPPGAIVPVYLVSCLVGYGPTPTLTMGVSLFAQFFTAWFLGMAVLLLLTHAGFPRFATFCWACVPVAFYLFLRSPFYDHQMGYFSDEAVMPFFAAMLLLEAWRMNTTSRAARFLCGLLFALVSFCGILCDWLFAFVLACVFLARFLQAEPGAPHRMRRFVLFWTPPVIAIALYAAQLTHYNAFGRLAERFVFGAGVEQGGTLLDPGLGERVLRLTAFFTLGLDSRFWKESIPMAYGSAGVRVLLACGGLTIVLLMLVLALRILRRNTDHPAVKLALATFLAVAPCFLYAQVFRAHCSILLHFFTTLKFAVPFAMVPLVLVPGLLLLVLRNRFAAGRWRIASVITAVACLGMAAAYLIFLGDPHDTPVWKPLRPEYERIGRFIGAHTAYEDVLFSDNFRIGAIEPHYLVYAMKRLYPVDSIADIAAKMDPLPENAVIALFARGPGAISEDQALAALAGRAFAQYHAGELHLWKITRKAFDAFLAESGSTATH